MKWMSLTACHSPVRALSTWIARRVSLPPTVGRGGAEGDFGAIGFGDGGFGFDATGGDGDAGSSSAPQSSAASLNSFSSSILSCESLTTSSATTRGSRIVSSYHCSLAL